MLVNDLSTYRAEECPDGAEFHPHPQEVHALRQLAPSKCPPLALPPLSTLGVFNVNNSSHGVRRRRGRHASPRHTTSWSERHPTTRHTHRAHNKQSTWHQQSVSGSSMFRQRNRQSVTRSAKPAKTIVSKASGATPCAHCAPPLPRPRLKPMSWARSPSTRTRRTLSIRAAPVPSCHLTTSSATSTRRRRSSPSR